NRPASPRASCRPRPPRAGASSTWAARCARFPPVPRRCSRPTCSRRGVSCGCSPSRSSGAPRRTKRCWPSSPAASGARRPSAPRRRVLATPAATTAALLAPHAPAAAGALRAIPHGPVAVVCAGFRTADGLGVDLDAYGFVVARGEGVRLLGCQYESSVFPDRAPAGGVLLRALLGGTFDPGLVDADDGAIANQALDDLRRVTGLARDPDFVDVWRA